MERFIRRLRLGPGGRFVTHSIDCPRCRGTIAVKDARPGRFRVDCPKCGSPMAITVPDDPAAPPLVVGLEPPATTALRTDPVPVAPAPEAPPVAPEPEPVAQPPRWLGGYRVGRALGVTRAGGLFAARGWAGGREVALAILKPRWAADAGFVARFAREAYASAQLDHPNLAPVVDLGVDRGSPFAAIDAIAGAPLSDPARGRAGLDRTARAAAVLHAARGLRHAHEQQVFHRDLDLDKIRVEDSGLVRLAGVGLGLAPETPVGPTVAPVALAGGPIAGTPPPPEPPSASAAREDVAALGRAFQSLIGGSRGDRAVPPGLASVARRMAGEGPDERFADLGAAVRALEAELGVAGPFAPTDAEAAELEACARAFEEPPLARVRPLLGPGLAGIVALFALLFLVNGRPLTSLGFLAFGALAGSSLVAFRGAFATDPLFDRARAWLVGSERGDALTAGAVAALVVGTLVATHWLGTWIFLTGLAVALAAAYHFALDRPIAQARADSIARASALLKSLRRRGVAEDDVRRFACRQPGAAWEELYEALFGFDALRAARARWGPDAGGKRRPRHAAWRDPLVDAIDGVLEGRRRGRDRAWLGRVEERGLEARGINLLTARRKGGRVAEATVALAAQYRRSADGSLGLPLMNALLRATERPEEFLAAPEIVEAGPPAWRESLGTVARFTLGPRARFLLGGVLLAGFLLWMDQNSLISTEDARQAILSATTDREKAVADAEKIGRKLAADVQSIKDAASGTKPLEVGHLAPGLARRLDGFGLGLAGLLLILSAAFRGIRFTAFAVPGALVAVLGPNLVDPAARTLGPTSLVALALGAGLFALGLVFGRERD